MGKWILVVEGNGFHHNMGRADIRPSDADLLAQQFVQKLKDHGHEIERADFLLVAAQQDVIPGPRPVFQYKDEERVDYMDPEGPKSAKARLEHRMAQNLEKLNQTLLAAEFEVKEDKLRGDLMKLTYTAQ